LVPSERIPSLISRFSQAVARASDFDPAEVVRVRLLLWVGVRTIEDIFRQVEEGALPRHALDLLGGSWSSPPVFRDVCCRHGGLGGSALIVL